jgi:hypothetical protein
MAMRLAFDLGLHLDMIPYVEKGIISTEECNTRRTIFWAAYINEQYAFQSSLEVVHFYLPIQVLGLLFRSFCS